MFDISPIQIIIVLAIALLIFGPKKLPGMGRDLGRGIRDFKAGITGEDEVERRAEAVVAPVEPTAQDLITEAATPEGVTEDVRQKAAAGA